MRYHFFKHDPGALVYGKVGDAGADGRKGDRPQSALTRDLQAAARRAAQAYRAGPAAQPHARRVDDEPRRQRPPAGDGSVADRDRALRPALGLNLGSASSRDRPGDPAAQLKVVIRRIDDGVDVLLRQVAL